MASTAEKKAERQRALDAAEARQTAGKRALDELPAALAQLEEQSRERDSADEAVCRLLKGLLIARRDSADAALNLDQPQVDAIAKCVKGFETAGLRILIRELAAPGVRHD